MGSTWLQLRTDLRAGWRSLLALALLVALAGGAVLGALAGAHRTATAYDRMLDATNAADMVANPDQGTDSALQLADIAAIPGVATVGRVDGVMFLPEHVESIEQLDTAISGAASDGTAGYDVSRQNVLSGRAPDPDEPFEVLANAQFAEDRHLRAGDRLTIRALRGDDIARLFASSSDDEAQALLTDTSFGELVALDVVGIGVSSLDLITEAGFRSLELAMTPAYWEHFGEPSAGWWGSLIRLDGGAADVPRVEAAIQALVPDEPIAFQTQAATTTKVDRTTRPYVVALLGFAGVAALLGLLVIVQAVSRRARQGAVDERVLFALGVGHRARFGTRMLGLGAAIVVGTVGAVVVAWSVSPIAPIGPVRDAEPAPGLRFDGPVLGLGALVLIVLVVALSAIPVWRATRVRPVTPRVRSSWTARNLARTSTSPTRAVGVRFALEAGSAPSSVPTRAVLVGAASAIALAAALLTFGSSLDRFVDTPRLFGRDWNVVVDGDVQPEAIGTVRDQLDTTFAAMPEVAGYSFLAVSETQIESTRVPTLSLSPSDRPITPTVVEGSAPTAATDLALGRATADRLGLDVGDSVTVTDPQGAEHLFTLTGTMVLPEVGTYGGSDKTSLGDGALMTPEGIQDVAEGFDKKVAVLLVHGDAPVDTVRAELPTLDRGDWVDATAAPTPAEVTTLARLRSTPSLLLGMLVVLLAAAVAHSLLVAFRARRHDVAVLQALGYRPRQVVTTSLWQATATAAVAVVFGLPIGVIVGRWVWRLVVQQLAAVVEPATPVVGLLALTLGVLALVNALGLIPGIRASRRRTAEALRAE